MLRTALGFWFVTLLLLAPCATRAASVQTIVDNDTDLFWPGAGTTDRNYTMGSRVAWFSEPGAAPRWAERVAQRVPALASVARQTTLSLAVGQEIYTPDALSASRRIANDRPYAGWLYGAVAITSHDAHTLRSVELDAGLVGPDSYAQQAQEWWHAKLGIRRPRGWPHQLRNEPGVRLRVQEARRPWGPRRRFDLVPHAGFSLGNVLTDVHAGGTVRVGPALPDDFGPWRAAPPSGLGPRRGRAHAYAFARIEGRAVAHSIVLDGNTGGGASVTRVPLVGEVQLGAGIRAAGVGLRYTFSYTTNEYRERPDGHRYGSVAIDF